MTEKKKKKKKKIAKTIVHVPESIASVYESVIRDAGFYDMDVLYGRPNVDSIAIVIYHDDMDTKRLHRVIKRAREQ
jgi:hypothetical protein